MFTPVKPAFGVYRTYSGWLLNGPVMIVVEPFAGWVAPATNSRSPLASRSLPSTYTLIGWPVRVVTASLPATGAAGSTVTVATPVAALVVAPSLNV